MPSTKRHFWSMAMLFWHHLSAGTNDNSQNNSRLV